MSRPYTVQLDQDSARELAQRGGTLLFLDMPEGCAVGIDQQTFLVGPKFKGVKMLPPGPHVVSYSSSSGQGDFGPTTSFFLFIKSGQVVVRRWDAKEEVLQGLKDEDEAERFASGVRRFEFDSSLAPYDLRSYASWRQLSSHIRADVIDAVQPLSGNISILAEGDPGSRHPATAAEEALSRQLQEGRAARAATQQAQRAQQAQQGGMEVDADAPLGHGGADVGAQGEQEGGGGGGGPAGAAAVGPAAHAGSCYYTPLPRLIKRPGLTPSELTALNLDKSPLLEELLADKFRGSEDALLGEFQFAFLAFLLGQSLEGFAQWRAFLTLLLGCEAAPLGSRAGLFARFLQALHAQLAHSLGGGQRGPTEEQSALLGAPILPEELLHDSFLRRQATQFLGMLHEERALLSPDLAEAAQKLGGLLGRRLGWGAAVVRELGGEDSEEDEDGPVVVEEGAAGF